ncbi:MAG TPA: DnaA/Hda family protein [Burkholderiales bacterium]|nr:DnaA/Hda family protein [Burkholderiales bacterium]
MSEMQQLPLDISARPEPRFSNFAAGQNREALAAVQALAEGGLREAVVYLWGAPGSGRTHLLRAAADANPDLTIADDVEGLDEAGQQALFMAINEARDGKASVLAAGTAPPAGLHLREDVRTRLAWGLVFQLKPLTDRDRKAHLRAAAADRGLHLGEDVADYLLARMPRDVASLNAALDWLDRVSLAKQRPLTIPLIREALAEGAQRALLPRQGDRP